MGEDRARFPTAASLLTETGTAPVTRSSGRSRTVRFRQQSDATRHRLVDRRRGQGKRLDPRGLPAGAEPRAATQPRPAGHRRPLDQDPVALLDRPHHLPARATPQSGWLTQPANTPGQTRAVQHFMLPRTSTRHPLRT
ncbi:MAG: hypothetical protein ACRCYU_03955 [Nocardioides sp.]